MSRRFLLALRFGLIAGCLACSLAIAAPTYGQGQNSSLHQLLAMEIETKDFTEPMPLSQALQLLGEKFAAQGLNLAILADANSFAKQADGPVDILNDQVRLPAYPKVLTAGKALRIFIGQVKTSNAAMLLRNGKIEIVPQADASPSGLLRYRVQAHFAKTPLSDTMRQLSYISGASILLDPRLKETAQAPVTADFRGDISLESALRSVADMADARIVLLIDGGIYVTTPANADALERRMRERRKELDNEKAKQKPKDAAA